MSLSGEKSLETKGQLETIKGQLDTKGQSETDKGQLETNKRQSETKRQNVTELILKESSSILD